MDDFSAQSYASNLNSSKSRPIELSLADPLNLFGLTPFAPFNPSVFIARRGLATIDEMRRDDQVKAAIMFKKHAVLSTGWEIVSPEDQPEDWEVTAFVRYVLDALEGDLTSCLLEILTALDYGYSVTEKIWAPIEEGRWDGKIGLVALKTRKPHSFEFDSDKFGNLKPDGVLQQQSGKGVARLPRDKFVIYSHAKEFGNWYGTSDLEAAYRAWWTKKSTYKWLAMLLERFGIPPIFVLYDPERYSGPDVEKLKTITKTIQAATGGVIPRATKDSIEMWAPELADQAAKVFIPALQMMNTDIARAVLMPGLLGLTPQLGVGSLARSKTEFNVFELVINFLREVVQERIVMDQIIRPIVDLNYASIDKYPRFSLLTLQSEARFEMFKAWGELVGKKIVIATDEDERLIRADMNMPERDFDAAVDREQPGDEPDPKSDDEPDDEPGVVEDDPDDGGNAPPPRQSDNIHAHVAPVSRKPNRFEKRVDFAAIERTLDSIQEDAEVELVPLFEKLRDRVIADVSKNFDNDIAFAEQFGIGEIPQIEIGIGRFMREAQQSGVASIRDEMPKQFADFPNLIAKDAVNFLALKRFFVTGVTQKRIEEEARGILVRSIESGALAAATTAELRELFTPYVGDPARVVSGKVVTPHRLQTIIRTNTTDAFNRGRIVQAKRAGDLLTGFEYSAIVDSRVTEVCRFLDGRVFRRDDPALDQLKPPRHFNCRSLLVPITIDVPVETKDIITKAQVGRGQELSGKGFS